MESYIHGCATQLRESLLKTSNQTNLMPGAQFDLGLFDLCTAVSVFNNLTITDMNKAFKVSDRSPFLLPEKPVHF